jgi:hypothetical protein
MTPGQNGDDGRNAPAVHVNDSHSQFAYEPNNPIPNPWRPPSEQTERVPTYWNNGGQPNSGGTQSPSSGDHHRYAPETETLRDPPF